MMKPFVFETDCVHANGDDITDMVDMAREIKVSTFLKHVDIDPMEFGVDLRKDWHVHFYKSKYKGKPCYFLDHSCIEYVYVKPIYSDLTTSLYTA